jgi:hypothetical protein
MTALTTRPDKDDVGLQPVPWRRMAGVTWRQHRVALAGVAVLLGALAVYEWLTGESLQQAWAAVIACHPASSPACQNLVRAFPENFLSLGSLLQVVPALIGAFVGAPVLARELRAAPPGTPGPRVLAGGAGRSPSWCCSGSCWPPPLARSALWCPGITSRTSPRATRP